MAEMTRRERLRAVLLGQAVDRMPVAFWRHFPGDDQNEESLVQVTLDFQRRYDLDFMKLPVSSSYTVTDYGVKHEYHSNVGGDRTYTECVIKKVEDWRKIEPLDIHQGTYGWHLRSLRRIIQEKEDGTPVVVTMFHPLALAFYLAGQETCLVHLRTNPEPVEKALKALAQTSSDFARAAIFEGADGIFLSARFADYAILSETEYNRFARPGDLAVLEAAATGWFNILHVHGHHPMVRLLADYPAKVLNWHDRTARPDLAEAAHFFPGALMGGVDQYQTLELGTPEKVISQVHSAIKQMSGRRLIVAPGCTYPLDVPQANLLAMRRAVESA
jgi:uroporphyrinogen decarboxylase